MYASSCLNNQSYTFEDYSCISIKTNETLRQSSCLNEQVRDNCPQTCGLCCENDPNFTFKVNGTIPKRKTCEWLGKGQHYEFLNYCDFYQNKRMVKEACAKSCSFCSSFVQLGNTQDTENTTSTSPSPTYYISNITSTSPSPTYFMENITSTSPSPTYAPISITSCVEEGAFYIGLNDTDYSCHNIRNQEEIQSEACSIAEVRSACPISCGLCCADDQSYSFETNQGKNITCEWIAAGESRKSKYCNRHKGGRFVRDACAETCESCNSMNGESWEIGGLQDETYTDNEYPIGLVLTFGFVAILAVFTMYIHFCRLTNDDVDDNKVDDDTVDILSAEDGRSKMLIPSVSSKTIDEAFDNEYYFPSFGVKMTYFDEFITECGGRERLEGLTTAEVCEHHVKKMTMAKKSSLCQVLYDKNHKVVGKATIFISHTWEQNFLKVVDALQFHMRDTPDRIIWFDLFSINQYLNCSRSYGWWSTTFMAAIKDMGHTVMVMSPWNDHVILSRSWCLFEAYSTRIGNCKFEIALAKPDRETLIKNMEENPNIEKMIGEINFETSESSKKDDKKMVMKVIEDSLGFKSANTMVLELIRKWLIDTAKEELENNDDEWRTWKLLHMLGIQFQSQGKLELSKQLLEKCLQQQQRTLGLSHSHTLSTLQSLSDVYCKMEFYDKARKTLDDVYLRRKETLGKEHKTTIGTLNALAEVHLLQNNYDEAKRIYEDVHQARSSALGPNHPHTLNTMSNLALLYRDSGETEEAKLAYAHVLEQRKNVLGESHPKTLSTLHSLASLCSERGEEEQAKSLFETCLIHQREALGENHPDTLGTTNNLAVLYHKEGEYSKAKKMYEECLKQQKAALGEEHPDTLGTLHNLVLLYEQRP